MTSPQFLALSVCIMHAKSPKVRGGKMVNLRRQTDA